MPVKTLTQTQEKFLREKVILPVLIQWRWEDVCDTLTLSKELTEKFMEFLEKEKPHATGLRRN